MKNRSERGDDTTDPNPDEVFFVDTTIPRFKVYDLHAGSEEVTKDLRREEIPDLLEVPSVPSDEITLDLDAEDEGNIPTEEAEETLMGEEQGIGEAIALDGVDPSITTPAGVRDKIRLKTRKIRLPKS